MIDITHAVVDKKQSTIFHVASSASPGLTLAATAYFTHAGIAAIRASCERIICRIPVDDESLNSMTLHGGAVQCVIIVYTGQLLNTASK